MPAIIINIIQYMAHLTNKIYTSPYSFYSKHLNYELWAHLQSDHVLMQLKSFLNEGIIKTFSNTVPSLICSNLVISPQYLFSVLNKEQSMTIDAKNGIIKLQFKYSQISNETIKKQIKLQQKINEPSLDNWMILNIIKQTSLLNRMQQESQYSCSKSTSGQVRPILHDNSLYRFQAELDVENKQILTELFVKKSDQDSKFKGKSFKSIIKQKDWGDQYQKKFQNIQTLFEHLRNSNNYQVLYNKGLIKIRNQPNIIKQSWTQKHHSRKSSQKILITPYSSSKKIKTRNQQQNQLQKKISLIQQQLNLSKQLQTMGQKIENKLRIVLKQTQNQINKKQRSRFQSYDNKFADLEKQLKKYFKQKLKQYNDQLKTQILKSVKPTQSMINTRKSHVFQVIKKPFNKINEQQPKPQIKIQQSLLLDPKKIKKFAIDQHNSSQFTQFKLQNHDIVQYIGAWDWTQIYTNVPILLGYTYKFTYKIIHSVYNAIAIGVSGACNIVGRSSLTKTNSISYWGDGQVWEGSKIKQESRGFRVGQTVTMQVSREKGYIQWHVNGVVKARHDSIILKAKQNVIYAYLQMYDSGDKIQLIQFTA